MTSRAETAAHDHFPALDGLRAVAILTVLAHNLTNIEVHRTLPERVWTAIVDAGWIGVQLFFVLSGFLITGILLADRGRPRYFRTFFVRRALRIFPLYFLFLGVRFFVIPWVVPGTSVPWTTQLWFWLYLSNWYDLAFGGLAGMGHLWSLAVEEQFYVSWPLVTARARPVALLGACALVIVGSLLTRVAMRGLEVPSAWMYASTVARADGLAFGAFVALALRDEAWRKRMGAARKPAFVLSIGGLVVVAAVFHGLSRANWVVQTFGYSLLAMLFAVIVSIIVEGSRAPWVRLLSHPALGLLGRYSYATYLIHLPLKHVGLQLLGARMVVWSASSPLMTDVAFVTAVSTASFVFAIASYALIEKPALSLKDRWAPR